MKQKSILWSLVTLMMVMTLGVIFVACGDDNDNNNSNNGSAESTATGVWKGSKGKRTLTIYVNSGGQGTYVYVYNDSYSGDETETGSFTYTMESNTRGIITMKEYDSYSGNSVAIYSYVIDGNTMQLYEDKYDELRLVWTLTKQ